MKRLISIACLFFCLALNGVSQDLPYVAAHRGGHIKGLIPENSIAGVASAKRFGYGTIECDPKFTSDGVLVVMHDQTINRTMRLKDGYKKIQEPVYVKETSFKELREKYVLASDDPAQRVMIPTLEELALECKRQGIRLMLHTGLLESCRLVRSVLGEDWICFTSDINLIRTVRSDGFKGLCLFSTKELDAEKVKSALKGIAAPIGISSMDLNKKKPGQRQYTPEFIKSLKDAGLEVQCSIFRNPWEVLSLKDGVTMMLTDYFWLQTDGRKPISKWNVPRKKYSAGQTLGKSFEKLPEYGAILLELSFSGDVDLEVNGFRYSFSHKSMEKEIVGIRLCGAVPSLSMTVRSDARFGKSKVSVYSL